MRSTKFIAFTGLAGSGKSTAAEVLAQAGYKHVSFAAPLKDMLRTFLRAGGLDDDQIERRIEGDLKEIPDPRLEGKTPRFAMQFLGTEWGREALGENIWTNLVKDRFHREGGRFVCSDCRFPNEADVVHDLGGIIVHVESVHSRRDAGDHSSETMDFEPDFTIKNNGTLESFRENIAAFFCDPTIQSPLASAPGWWLKVPAEKTPEEEIREIFDQFPTHTVSQESLNIEAAEQGAPTEAELRAKLVEYLNPEGASDEEWERRREVIRAVLRDLGLAKTGHAKQPYQRLLIANAVTNDAMKTLADLGQAFDASPVEPEDESTGSFIVEGITDAQAETLHLVLYALRHNGKVSIEDTLDDEAEPEVAAYNEMSGQDFDAKVDGL